MKKDISIVIGLLLIVMVSLFVSTVDMSSITGGAQYNLGHVTVNVFKAVNNAPVREMRIYVSKFSEGNINRWTYKGRTKRDGFRSFVVSPGEYRIKLSRHGYENVFSEFEVVAGEFLDLEYNVYAEGYSPECLDGTPYGSCSEQPFYCDPDTGSFVERCQVCGCPGAKTCLLGGGCSVY